MEPLPPLPLVATFSPRGRRRKYGLDQMVTRLRKEFPRLEASPVKQGVWSTPKNSVQEFAIRFNAEGVGVQFSLCDLPTPCGDAFIQVANFDPLDSTSMIAASNRIADVLGFHVEINTLPSWGIEVWAIRDETPKQAAISQSCDSEQSIELARQPLANWPAACEQAASAWCAKAETLRPSSKKKMLKMYNGPEGISQTLLRDLAGFGKMTAWYEVRRGASHENTALLRVPPWSLTVRFSGVRNGKLRL